MCDGYHARLSRDEEKEILNKRKKEAEERMKEAEKVPDIRDEEKEFVPGRAYQGA